MKSKLWFLISVLVVIGMVLSGCAKPTPTPKPVAKPTAVPAVKPTEAPPAEPIKIAILAPLSGDVKTFGESTRDGALMAFDEWNAKGGVLGRQIEVIIGDSKCDAQEAANAANKVIFEDGVHYIVGEVCSSASIPISEITEAEGVLQISPTSTNPAVTINEDGSNKEYVFRACFLDPFQGEVVAALAMELGAKTSAVLYDVGNDYVKGLAEYYKLAFESMGGTVSVFEAYTKEDTDFSAILTKVAAANPDALFLPDYYSKNNLIAAQIKEKGITAQLLGGDGWDSPELDMPLFEGGYHSNHYSPADPRPLVQDFVKAYTDKYGAEPDALATLAYDAAHILCQAIENAGVDDPAVVKDAMAALQFEGVSGEITFDAHGDPVKKAAIIKVEGGKKVFYKFVAPAAAVPVTAFKVGMVTDVGGIDDKSFNATSWKGVADAIANLGVAGQYLESQQQTDYAKNITEFLEQGYDMLVTVGFLLGDDTAKFGAENPDVPFAIVDYAYDPTIPNVLGLVFNTDGAAFLAGYLAAGMTKTGKVGTFGGIEIPPVTIFMVGFESGVKYYNEKHGTNVEVLGTSFYVGNFESTDDGRRAGESLMDEGADIVMPVAGPVGLGTAAAVQERGGMLIGVDTDWYVSAPEYKDIVLTSVLKNMDVAVYTAIESAVKGTFEGGVYVGTLANNGVGIAPFNAFDADVSAELKAELEEIKQDLIDGTIWTGWGEEPAPKVTGEPVTLAFWHTQEPEAFRGKLLEEMIQDFQKEYPWITIESSYQGSYTDLYRKMMATIAAGEMPDFAVAYPSQISEYMQADAVVSLDAYINDPEIGLTEGDLKDIFPGFLAECRFAEFDNQYLAFPFTKSYVGMWYNMDLLRAAGWDYVPTTWAEFEQACNDVSDKTEGRGYAFYESASTFDAWLFSRGAEQLSADQTEAVFNGPEGVESLAMMLRLIESGGAWKPEGSYADQAEFGQGNAAFTMSSTSGTYYYRQAVEDSGTGPEEWGQAMIPQSDPSNPKTVMYGASICVFKTTEAKQRAAWLFIRYFSDTAQTALWGSTSGYIPVRASAAALLDEFFAGEPVAREQFEKIVPFGKPEPSVRGSQEIRDFLYDAMVAAFSGVATPQEALDEAVELANEALARGRE